MAATVSIASISDQDWYISRTHGVYHISACAKGQPYSLLMTTASGDALDLGDNRRFPCTNTAQQIAEDLLQDLHDHGIFICAGPRLLTEELTTAMLRRDSCASAEDGRGRDGEFREEESGLNCEIMPRSEFERHKKKAGPKACLICT
jgi:hypothetical protein